MATQSKQDLEKLIEEILSEAGYYTKAIVTQQYTRSGTSNSIAIVQVGYC